MNKALAVLTIASGFVSGLVFFAAGLSLSRSGHILTGLRSKGGESVAEVYYQQMGHYGVAFSLMAYAFGLGIIALSLGIGSRILVGARNA